MSDEEVAMLMEGIYKAPIGFALFGLDGDDPKLSPLVIKYLNEVGAGAIGAAPELLVNKSLEQVIPDAIGGPFDLGIRETLTTGKPKEVLIRDGEREDTYVSYRLKVLPLARQLALVTLVEVTNESILEREYKYERRTSLASRAYFDDVLHEMLAEHAAQRGHLGVLYVDLDKFKAVNDTYGHVCGDELLTNLAQRLRALRPEPKMIARWGGDEFAILTEWPREQNLEFAQMVLDEVALPFSWAHEDIGVQMSIGLVTLEPHQQPSMRELMIAVDKAMYVAKNEGGGKISEVSHVAE